MRVSIQPNDAQSAGSKPVHPQLMMYKCVAKPWVMRLGALLLGAASFMVVWSEATIGLGRKPDVSPFSLVLAMQSYATPHWLLLLIVPPSCLFVAPCSFPRIKKETKCYASFM